MPTSAPVAPPIAPRVVTDADIGTAPSQPVYSPELLAARAAAQRRRAAAMVTPFDTFLGQRFHALNPATHSRLLVLQSPFLWEVPAGPGDVLDYLWLHSQGFDEQGRGRADFERAIGRLIEPRWLRWRHSRAGWIERTSAAYARLAVDIAERIGLAFADSRPAGDGGRRVSASLEAQLIHGCAELYRWDPERVRRTPIRQLNQFLNAANGTDYSPEEIAATEQLLAALP